MREGHQLVLIVCKVKTILNCRIIFFYLRNKVKIATLVSLKIRGKSVLFPIAVTSGLRTLTARHFLRPIRGFRLVRCAACRGFGERMLGGRAQLSLGIGGGIWCGVLGARLR